MEWMVVLILVIIRSTFLGIPAWTRPTVPLGVCALSERVHEPVVVSSIRSSRVWSIVVTLVGIALALLLRYVSAAAQFGIPYVVLGSCLVVFALARHPVQRAQATGVGTRASRLRWGPR